MLKALLVSLYQRVVLSYKSTLLGLALLAGLTIADSFLHSPNKMVSMAGFVLGGVLALFKDKVKVPPESDPQNLPPMSLK